jgi:hypothetical protein
MVTASVNGPTYRVGIFLDSILKPVAASYCSGELVKDSTEFLNFVEYLNTQDEVSNNTKLVALDVDALYPNIKIELALEAIKDALVTTSSYSNQQIEMIGELAEYTLRNSVVHYRGNWFKSKEGAPTGGPESPSIANIHVKYVLDKKILDHVEVRRLNSLDKRKRFLDDIWAFWKGTYRTFEKFLDTFNKIGKEFGITVKGGCSDSVEFLDVTTKVEDGRINTTMYVKPTDSLRYLNRRSFHSPHTFSGIPFSQFRRASVICSDVSVRNVCIDRMVGKFKDSGYTAKELLVPAERARSQVRQRLLENQGDKTTQKDDIITMIINKDCGLKKVLNSFFESVKEEFTAIVGEKRILVAERRLANTASLLFSKAGFSQTTMEVRDSQKCMKSKRCKNCPLMNLGDEVVCDGTVIKLDMRCCCTTEGVIYVALCRYCEKGNFYFGQSENSLQERNRGHRFAFKISEYEKSALSLHTYECHVEKFEDKLLNFNFGIVKHVSPGLLDKWEDFYIWKTDADIKGLNRYKVCA